MNDNPPAVTCSGDRGPYGLASAHTWWLPDGWQDGQPCLCGKVTIGPASQPSKEIAALRADCLTLAAAVDLERAEVARLTRDRDHWKITADAHALVIEEDLQPAVARLTQERDEALLGWKRHMDAIDALLAGAPRPTPADSGTDARADAEVAAREIIGPHDGSHDSPQEWCTTCRCLADGLDQRIAAALVAARSPVAPAPGAVAATPSAHVYDPLSNENIRALAARADEAERNLASAAAAYDAQSSEYLARAEQAEATSARLRELVVEASYLLQGHDERDAAYQGWREKAKAALASAPGERT